MLGIVLLNEKLEFLQSITQSERHFVWPKGRVLNLYSSLLCGSSGHTGSLLRKTWTRLNGCSHWIHLYFHNGPLGPRFIEEKGCMNVEKGAVIVSFSYLQGSRNNPEFHMIGLPYPSRADQGQGGLPWIQLSMKLSFEFTEPQANREQGWWDSL